MKKNFYLIFKLPFVLKIIKFLTWLTKKKLISKFMTIQTGKQIILIHIMPNVSKSTGNQSMKFGQLIDIMWKVLFSKNHAQMHQGD